MAHTVKQLQQLRPNSTNPEAFFSPEAGEEVILHNIVICNTSGAAAKYSLFHDADGSTYDENTALVWEATIAGGTTISFDEKLLMDDENGNIGIQTDTSDALTFTAHGEVFTS